ncbi:hypothetical protein [Streptomyces jumonjinensis]|uniref:hypothetical protein n=1 Tax=Streptomyces jumonjinensis TaxID=1945 RepID=UPI0037AABD96
MDQTQPPATGGTRICSALAATLFVPAVLATLFVAFSTDRASRCLTYGEQCGWSLPGWLFWWGAGLGALACAVACVAATARVRRPALAVQLVAECGALAVILSQA